MHHCILIGNNLGQISICLAGSIK